MLSAWILGSIGVILIYALGLLHLGLDWLDATRCFVGSEAGALAALFVYSKSMRHPWLRKNVMFNTLSTYVVFVSIYLGTELLLAPAMRDPQVFGWLVLPTILVTCFAILIYGPIQDSIVAREQKSRQK